MNILASIVIITYNRGHSLNAVINSIHQSTFKDYEIIVIDDGSTDDTYQVLKHLIDNKEIRYFYQENTGVSGARNYGILKSKGKYIAFIDSDIICTNTWLQKLIDVASSNSDIGILAAIRYNKENFKYKEIIERQKYPGENVVTVSKIGMGASLVKREVFEKIGGFDSNFIFGWEDVELSFRANLLGYKVVYVYDAIVYHFHDRTKRSRLPKDKFSFENAKNRIYTYLKLMSPTAVTIRLCKDVLKIIYYLPGNKNGAILLLKALRWNIKNIKSTLEQRKRIFQNLKVSHKELIELERKESARDKLYARFVEDVIKTYLSNKDRSTY